MEEVGRSQNHQMCRAQYRSPRPCRWSPYRPFHNPRPKAARVSPPPANQNHCPACDRPARGCRTARSHGDQAPPPAAPRQRPAPPVHRRICRCLGGGGCAANLSTACWTHSIKGVFEMPARNLARGVANDESSNSPRIQLRQSNAHWKIPKAAQKALFLDATEFCRRIANKKSTRVRWSIKTLTAFDYQVEAPLV